MKPIKEKPKARTSDFTKDEIIKQVNENITVGMNFWQDIYNQALEDENFVSGKQWEDQDITERENAQRPILTLNHLQKYVSRVIGKLRKNEHTIKVIPTDETSNTATFKNIAGSKDYDISETFQGVIRNIEYQSKARQHYKKVLKQQLEGGIGWLRVITKYADNDTFNLEAVITSVDDRTSVITDPYATEPDLSDMRWAVIYNKMRKDDFFNKYPDASIGGFPEFLTNNSNFWGDDDKITVAEYFVKYPIKDTLVLLSDMRTIRGSEFKDIEDELLEHQIYKLAERPATRWKIKWYLLTAYEILEETEWIGQTIPIIPVIGREEFVNRAKVYKSLITDAKDAQKLHNYWITSATEKIALSPKSPFIAEEGAIDGYEDDWANANRNNKSTLVYRTGFARPQRERPADMPAAELQMAMVSSGEITETTGMSPAYMGERSNEVSAKAIMAKSQSVEDSTFEFEDNFYMALESVGKILVEIIPKIYPAGRLIRLQFPNGKHDYVRLGQTIHDDEKNKDVVINDLGVGQYDVQITVGKPYRTQMEEMAGQLIGLAELMPNVGQVAGDLLLKAFNFPYHEEIADRLAKTLPPELLEPEKLAKITKEQIQSKMIQQQIMQQMGYQPPPSPQAQEDQMKLAKKQEEIKGKQIDNQKRLINLQAEQVKAQTEIAQAQAQTVNSVAEIKKLIAETLMEIINQQNIGGENPSQGGNNE